MNIRLIKANRALNTTRQLFTTNSQHQNYFKSKIMSNNNMFSTAEASPAAAPIINNNTKVKIAVGQLTSAADREQNLNAVASLVKQSSEQQCKFLFLPENFSVMGTAQSDVQAEPLNGPLFARYRALAKQHCK